MNLLKRKVESANHSEKAEIAHKMRALTPGAEEVISRLSLEER